MLKQLTFALLTITVLAGGGVGRAAPLDPLGETTGFVPPDLDTLKCENKVARNVRKAAKCIAVRCHKKYAIARFKNNPFDEQECEDTCRLKYNTLSAKIEGCPACLGTTAREALYDLVLDWLNQNNDLIYCEGSEPFGLPVEGFVPDGRASLHSEGFVGKQVGLGMACNLKCIIKAADTIYRGSTFNLQACQDKPCLWKYESLNDQVDDDAPACLKEPQRTALHDAYEQFIDTNNQLIYCHE